VRNGIIWRRRGRVSSGGSEYHGEWHEWRRKRYHLDGEGHLVGKESVICWGGYHMAV
jgi:hypothetical protein